MRAVDTDVLVRLIADDDPRQARIAEEFIARGAWVSAVALAETMWVLSRVYQVQPVRAANIIQTLLEHEHITLQDRDAVSAALILFRARPALGFTDCLLVELARKAGHLPVGTFDRALGKLEGAELLQ